MLDECQRHVATYESAYTRSKWKQKIILVAESYPQLRPSWSRRYRPRPIARGGPN
jgi:hypothetical protein